MQKTLDHYGAGVQVTQVQLQKVDPPAQVIDAFRDVQAARADQERLQNEARSLCQPHHPRGARRGRAHPASGARLSASRLIAEANGEADRFLSVYEQYKKAPDVTRKRMFSRPWRGCLATPTRSSSTARRAPGVVPYLPLTGVLQESRAPAEGQPNEPHASPLSLVISRHCRRRRLSDAVHRQPDAAGARARIRQAEARHHRAGAAI